ncbi:hypothetical protein GCM10009836_42880 [Pseudonocardia ailaonensis]|uniref:SsuA/THI5-like domain-containing protein n=2 Tax=Pseudonocardia ailaonensis TaxID=367279 RepID=A0ABN2N8V7_9PSEU
MKLTVALPAIDATAAEPAIGIAKGYYKNLGLDVQFTNSGSNILAAVLSGQADISVSGLPGPLLPAAQGKNLKIIAEKNTPTSSVNIAAKPSLTSVDQCKSVATTGVGTGLYNLTMYFQKAFNLNWTIKALSAPTDAVNLLLTGQVDCAVADLALLNTVVEAGKVKLLVSAASQTGLPPGFPSNLVGGVLYGLDDNLKAKKQAVVAFLTAWDQAVTLMNNSLGDAAQAIHSVPNWDAQPADSILAAIKAQQPGRWPGRGIIESSAWPAELAFLEAAGTSFPGGVNADIWSYDNRVDMSYLRAAINIQK